MKKNLRIFLVISFISISFSISGQFGNTTEGPSRQANPKEAQLIIERTLLVVLTSNEGLNTKIKSIVNEYWKSSKNIKFVAPENLEKQIEGQESKFSVLETNEVEITSVNNGTKYKYQYIRISIKLAEKLNNKKALYYRNISYPNDARDSKTKEKLFKKDKKELVFDLNKKEILYAIDFIQNHIVTRKGLKKKKLFDTGMYKFGLLDKKTLLIDKRDMAEGLTEQDIAKVYPYKFKVVNQSEIEKVYLSRNKDFAFVEVAPLGYASGILEHHIVSCEDGYLLSFGKQATGITPFNNLIDKGHLKAYAKNFNKWNK